MGFVPTVESAKSLFKLKHETMNIIDKAKNIHLVGIKGIGMTALAQVLQSMSKNLSGSDTSEIFFTDAILRKLAIPVHEVFSIDNITDDIELVITSAAYGNDNPEIAEAKKRNIPILHYPEALGLLSENRKSIGVAGTHGKTTTTALLGLAIVDLGLDPMVIVGSQVPQFGNTNAHIGKSEYLIAETCEYRRHFLNFHPQTIIITNIEEDHLDYYKDIRDILFAFKEYTDRLPVGGTLVCCIDDKGVQELLKMITRTDISIVTYGENHCANIRMTNYTVKNEKQSFQVVFKEKTYDFQMLIPGKHNCLNATGVIAATLSLLQRDTHQDQLFASLQKTLQEFVSTTRRLQKIGSLKDMIIFDDYGHHPTEIKATLKALKDFYPDRYLVVDFMPHTYTRTKSLFNEFSQAFKDANMVIINEIYASARENPIPSISGKKLAEAIKTHQQNVQYLSKSKVSSYIRGKTLPKSIFLTIGAGDNWKITQDLLQPL